MGRIAFDRFPQLPASVHQTVHEVVGSAAGQIVMLAASSMEGQTPPAPAGHAPAIRTGLLHGSLDSKFTGPLEAIAYTNVEYAQHVEYGTVHMAARPFIRPAAEQVRDGFEKAVKAAVRKGVR